MRFSALSLSLFVGEELAPPVAPNTAITTTVAKSQPPLAQHHVLASLVKGRWLDGKAQTVVLLRFNCDTSAFLFTKLLCRQDGRIALHPPSLSIPTTFSKAHQPFRPALNLPPSSKANFCCPKKFGRLPYGLLPIRTINEIFRTTTFITNYTKISYISFYHHLYS